MFIRFCFLAIMILSFASQSNPLIKEHRISINTTGFAFEKIAFEYQYRVNSFINIIVPLEGSLSSLSVLPNPILNLIRSFGYGFAPKANLLTGLGAMFQYQNWFIEPTLKIGYAYIEYPQGSPLVDQKSFLELTPAFLFGHQTIFDFGLMIKLGIGAQWRLFFPHVILTNVIAPNVTLALGYAF